MTAESGDGSKAAAGRVLVSGSDPRAGRLVTALEQRGVTVTAVGGRGDPASEVGGVGDGSIDCYVQLPVQITPGGEDLIAVVHGFLEQGLLSRFRLASAVLSKLAPGAGVLLVAGNQPPGTSTPDDHRARMGLLAVLAHAVRAETGDRGGWVEVVRSRADAEDIADLVHGRGTAGTPAVEAAAANAVAEFDYASWRTAVMTLAGGRSR